MLPLGTSVSVVQSRLDGGVSFDWVRSQTGSVALVMPSSPGVLGDGVDQLVEQDQADAPAIVVHRRPHLAVEALRQAGQERGAVGIGVGGSSRHTRTA